MGIFRFDRKGQIEGFEEKPSAARLEEMGGSLPAGASTDFTTPANKPFVASMGIYVFTRKALVEALAEANVVDFGHEIIPKALGRRKVRAYAFNGYWADVGTLRSFFDANICLTQPGAEFSFYHPTRPVFSRPRFLPPSWVDGGSLCRTVVSDGASVCHAEVEDSIVGLRMQVASGAKVKRAVLLGADEYDDRQTHDGLPPLGIGHDAVLENVIVDKNARIGDGAILVNSAGIVEGEGPGYVIREGIIVVPKGGVVPAGTKVGHGPTATAASAPARPERDGPRGYASARRIFGVSHECSRPDPAGGGRMATSMRATPPFLNSGAVLNPTSSAASSPRSGSWPTSARLAMRPSRLQRAQHVARLDARLQGRQLHHLRLLRERRRQQIGGLPRPRERAGQDQVRPRVDGDEAGGLAAPPLGALRGQRPQRVVGPGRAALLGDGVAH